MSDTASAEFGTVARWTAQAAADLGSAYHIPAGCRGSGSPAALDWLMDRMRLSADDLLLDCGAGVGGPAAYAAHSRGVVPVLVEPEAEACRAARNLFGYPVIRAMGSALPFADDSFDAVWSLGVLCTMSDQAGLLAELRRVVHDDGRIGLLVLLAHDEMPRDELQDTDFPTPDRLDVLIGGARLRVEHRVDTGDLPAAPEWWDRRVDRVTDVLTARHGHSATWRLAEGQSAAIGRLLDSGVLSAELLVLRCRGALRRSCLGGYSIAMADTALLVIDMVNDYRHTDAEALASSVEDVLGPLRRLVETAGERDDVELIYINDNRGDFTADFRALTETAMAGERPDLVEPILPEPGCRIVTKVRHSVFYATALDYLLGRLDVRRLVLTGQVTEQCILYSALDAYVRHYDVVVPPDAVAHIDADLGGAALTMMERNMRAELVPSPKCLHR